MSLIPALFGALLPLAAPVSSTDFAPIMEAVRQCSAAVEDGRVNPAALVSAGWEADRGKRGALRFYAREGVFPMVFHNGAICGVVVELDDAKTMASLSHRLEGVMQGPPQLARDARVWSVGGEQVMLRRMGDLARPVAVIAVGNEPAFGHAR